jgi:hypothetical protein
VVVELDGTTLSRLTEQRRDELERLIHADHGLMVSDFALYERGSAFVRGTVDEQV